MIFSLDKYTCNWKLIECKMTVKLINFWCFWVSKVYLKKKKMKMADLNSANKFIQWCYLFKIWMIIAINMTNNL